MKSTSASLRCRARSAPSRSRRARWACHSATAAPAASDNAPAADGGHHDAVPAHELADAISQRVRARQHRAPVEVTPKIVGESLCRWIAPLGLARERLTHDGVEVAAQSASPAPPLRGRAADSKARALRRGGGGLAVRTRLARPSPPLRRRRLVREQLEGQRSEAPHIGGGGGRLAGELLGRGIGRRQDARFTPVCRGEPSGARIVAMPKSSSLSSPLGRDQHVGRLEVAMDDQVAVGVRDRVARHQQEAEAILDRERALLGEEVDGLAVHALHDQVGTSVGERAAVDQPGDRRDARGARGCCARAGSERAGPRCRGRGAAILIATRCSNAPSSRSPA